MFLPMRCPSHMKADDAISFGIPFLVWYYNQQVGIIATAAADAFVNKYEMAKLVSRGHH